MAPHHSGDYTQYNIYGNLFEVSSKYCQPIRPIGRGAYGIVWSVLTPLYFSALSVCRNQVFCVAACRMRFPFILSWIRGNKKTLIFWLCFGVLC
jgi:hypothetical protein